MIDMASPTIDIVTACDNAYVQHTAIFLKSLFARNPNNTCRVFILVPENFIHRDSLERNLAPHVSSLEFIKINLSEIILLKVSHHVTAATYFRLFLDRLIPEHVNRIIYLDSDILITGPLDELWATDLDNYVVAAAIDAIVDTDQCVRKKIGLASTSHYFNAGVLLIDLNRWRNEKVGDRSLDFAVEHPELITWWDQCALNHVLNGRFKELAKDWNFQTHHLQWTKQGKCTAGTLRDLDSAKIIHFTGDLKPWYYLVDHPMKWLYWEFLRTTEWRDYWPSDRTGRNVLRKNLEKRAPALLNAIRRVRKLWRPTVV